MKKFLSLLLFLSLAMSASAQRDYNSSQLSLRTNIRQFLAEEGFMPEIDSDGDVKFKKEGKVYYVSVSSTDTSPMYLCLFINFSYGEKYTRQRVERNSNELNLYKGVKLVCYDNGYSYRAEMFLTNADAFRYTFYKLMEQLESMRDELIELMDSTVIM